MDVIYTYPGIEYSVESIVDFQSESDWWKDSLFHFYPQIDKIAFASLSEQKKRCYLHDMLHELCLENNLLDEIRKKASSYYDRWKLFKVQIEDAFSDAFQYDVKGILNNVVGNISFNPISPRYLETSTFDVFT